MLIINYKLSLAYQNILVKLGFIYYVTAHKEELRVPQGPKGDTGARGLLDFRELLAPRAPKVIREQEGLQALLVPRTLRVIQAQGEPPALKDPRVLKVTKEIPQQIHGEHVRTILIRKAQWTAYRPDRDIYWQEALPGIIQNCLYLEVNSQGT